MNFHKKNTFLSSYNVYDNKYTLLSPSDVYANYKINIKKTCEAKHYLPSNKEWVNSIYVYNNKNIINLPVKDKVLYTLLKSYFNLKKNKLKSIEKDYINHSNFTKKKFNSKTITDLIEITRNNIEFKKSLIILKDWQNLKTKSSKNKTLKIKKVIQKVWKRKLMKLKNSQKKIITRKVYLGLPDVKHYNNKSIITVSVYNRNKAFLKKKIHKFYKLYIKKKKLYRRRENLKAYILFFNNLKKQSSLNQKKIKVLNYLLKNNYNFTNNELYNYKLEQLNNQLVYINKPVLYKNIDLSSIFFRKKLYDIIITKNYKKINNKKINHLLKIKLRKMKYRLFWRRKFLYKRRSYLKLNKLRKRLKLKSFMIKLFFFKYKFNNSNLIGLKNIIRKLYNKKIILKLINLKYMYLDSNIITEALTKRLRNRKKRLLRSLKRIIRKIRRVKFIRKIWLEKLEINVNISSFNDENKLLNINEFYDIIPANLTFYKEFLMRSRNNIKSLILYNINHKIISGIKMQGSGRLTKRLTASRSVTKFRGKGSLKNINSSFFKLSTTMLRGYFKSNLQYRNINSYNRNGSFGIKTWISSY